MAIVDNFRFLGGLHTTARILAVCSAIVKIVGKKQLPIELIKKMSIEWSIELELSDSSYQERKGKLTEIKGKTPNKATTAFEHYIQLLVSLNLLHKTGVIVSTTRLALILNEVNSSFNRTASLNNAERIFYFFHLFNIDADALLLVMSMLHKNSLSQKEFLVQFKDAMTYRVFTKSEYANTQAQAMLREWYLKITKTWEKPEKYAEHLLVPRLEWLYDLGVVSITKKGSQNVYSLSEKGSSFYESIPIIDEKELRDINSSWIKNNLLGQAVKFIDQELNPLIPFNKLDSIEKKELFDKLMPSAFNKIDSSGAMRISLYPAYIYMVIHSVTEKYVYFELEELVCFLKEPVELGNKRYFVKETSRTTESYITLSL